MKNLIATFSIVAHDPHNQDYGVAVQSKAFSGSPNRTYLHDAKMTASDIGVIILFTVIFIAAAIAYVIWDVGKFGGPI